MSSLAIRRILLRPMMRMYPYTRLEGGRGSRFTAEDCREGVEILADGGLLIMYTGVPIEYRKPGHDPFLERLKEMTGAELVEYTIIHPDMWPEEVGKGAYAEVGRIQVVGAVLRKKP